MRSCILHKTHTSLVRTVTYYTIDQMVTPDFFDSDLEKVCTSGIHYFLTFHAAQSYVFDLGSCIVEGKHYDSNGRICIK